ncbi:hypothetical protein MMC13_005714 [Lambiella insularis]|nr:hypothetical protein [Lambiella insularis]
MDKAGNIIKAIVAAPTTQPIRDVESGCSHLDTFMEDSARAEKLRISFYEGQARLSSLVGAQTARETQDPKRSGLTQTILRPTYHCLQCNSIGSQEERDSHHSGHPFSIESRSGCLFCRECDDFVYDPKFEEIRIKQSLPSTANSRKRKLSAVYHQGDEDKFVLPNSNSLSCLAGAPRGIFNLGQTCYMGVILQALIHNPLMRNFFLSSRHETTDCPNPDCVACALVASFADVLATEKIDGHGPLELLYKSWQNNPFLAGYHQQDAHDFFQSLLNQLHTSCGCVDADSDKNCDCLYHRTFFGKLLSTVTCLQCRNETVTQDPIVDLSLDLQKPMKRRKLDGKATGAEAPLELSTCLTNFTTPEKLGVDAYTCKSKQCNNTPQRAKKHLTIKQLPPALCIQLKRYEQTKSANPQKLDVKLNFPLQLDMYPYTSRAYRNKKKAAEKEIPSPAPNSPLASRSPGWYDLSTVVVHIGKLEAGHYICYCRRDDQWFKFDDSKVTLASEKQVLNAEPYLLFYIIRSLGTTTGRRAAGENKNGVMARPNPELQKANGEPEVENGGLAKTNGKEQKVNSGKAAS